MVQFVVLQDVENTAGGAGPGIGRGINQPLDSGQDNGARAHGAGFQGDIQSGAGKAIILLPRGAGAQGRHLRMGRGITGGDGPVPTFAYAIITRYQDCADRDFTLCLGAFGQLQGPPHPEFVTAGHDPWSVCTPSVSFM